MISPKKIKYCDEYIADVLNQMDILLGVSFDSDNGEIETFLNRSAVSSESHDGRYHNTYRYKYDELFSPRFTIIKSDFSDFSQQEVRKVLKYLTSTDKPALLEVYYEDNSSPDFCAVGGWTEIETYKLANNRVVGVIATFTAVTPYAMSDLKTELFSDTDGYVKTISVDTDENQPVYPRITIEQTGLIVATDNEVDYDDMMPNTIYKYDNTFYWKTVGDELEFHSDSTKPDYNWSEMQVETELTSDDELEANIIYYNYALNTYYWMDYYTLHSSETVPDLTATSVKITNTHNGVDSMGILTTLIITNNMADEKIVVDCANRIISSSRTRRIFGDDFNWNWLALYDESNSIAVEGNCKVTFEWRTVKKIGA